MVAAKKSLLKLVRQMAVRDEILAMRLRGRLVVPAAGILELPPKTPSPSEGRK